jgi:hypothetical protein
VTIKIVAVIKLFIEIFSWILFISVVFSSSTKFVTINPKFELYEAAISMVSVSHVHQHAL